MVVITLAIFEFLYDTLMQPIELMGIQKLRQTLLQKAVGHVLEVGAGSGANFPYYPANTTVTALEPSPLLRRRASAKAIALPNLQVISGTAEALPFADEQFDTVVSTLVLCSVDDLDLAIREMHRVLKPGGRLLLLEHIASHHPVDLTVQKAINPAWMKMFGKCHLDRQTVQAVQKLFPETTERYYLRDLIIQLETKKTG